MRISASLSSPHHWGKAFQNPPEIYLDGVAIADVMEADEEEGTVTVMQMNGAYPIYAGGEFLTTIKTGKVEIREKTGE